MEGHRFSANNSLHRQNVAVMFVTLDKTILQLNAVEPQMDGSFKTENI